MASRSTIFKRDKIELDILLVPNTQKTGWIHNRKGVFYLVSLLFSNSSCSRRVVHNFFFFIKSPRFIKYPLTIKQCNWILPLQRQVGKERNMQVATAGREPPVMFFFLLFTFFLVKALLAPLWSWWNHCHNSMCLKFEFSMIFLSLDKRQGGINLWRIWSIILSKKNKQKNKTKTILIVCHS